MRIRWPALVAVLACLAASCVSPTSPARSYHDYAEKAANTAESVLSATETARLVVAGIADGDLFSPYAARMLSESEDGASGAQAAFDRLQPPGGARADALRSSLDELLGEAVDELSSLRIAARRGYVDHPAQHVERLDRISSDLETFAEEHQ